MSSIVPPEISDYIMDYLWDDYHALAACSLTCRAWIPTNRSHLFEFVHLEHESKIVQFLEILDHPSIAGTSISRCVRELVIAGTVARNHPRLHDIVLRILDRLNRVQCLQINTRGIPGWYLQDQLKTRLLTFSPEIRSLCVHSAHVFEWVHLDQLFELLSGFPNLSALEIDGGGWAHILLPPAPPPSTPLVVPQNISKVVLSDLNMMHVGRTLINSVLTLLHGPAFDLQLRRLRIDVESWIRHADIIRVGALNVKELYFNWDPLTTDIGMCS